MIRDLKLLSSLARPELDHASLVGVLQQFGYRAPLKKIHDLRAAGVLLAIKRGVYVVAPEYARRPPSREILANQLYGPSYISLETALSFYGLIPERVEAVTSVTCKRDKHYETPLGLFTYRYLSVAKYRHGLSLESLKGGEGSVFMASPTKALLDYAELRKGPRLNSPAEAERWLLEDLRIEAHDWSRFSVRELTELNRVYRNKSVEALVSVLLRAQE